VPPTPQLTPHTSLPIRLASTASWALVAALALSACRNAAIPFAGSAPGGPDRVQQAFTALYERYANVHHGPKYNYARTHLSSAALIPSHVFNDTAVWTAEPDSTIRELQIGEHVTAGATEQEAAIAVPLQNESAAVLNKAWEHEGPMMVLDGEFDPQGLALIKDSFIEMGILDKKPSDDESSLSVTLVTPAGGVWGSVDEALL